MQPKEILVLEGLTFGYDTIPLFEDLDLDFLEGSIVLLRGKNGTGKTTLCDIVAGALKADVRRCLWRGEEVDQEDLRLVVAYASQEPEFFPALSGMENLSLLQLLAEEPSEYLEKAVTTSLDLGLTKKDLERKQAGNYSGGMRQKLWIAAQLAKSRDFVILDEPFTSLDDETINTVSDMLKRDPRTRLLVSHQIPEGIDFADIIDLLGEDKEEDEG
jgi:ABC transporter related protein